MTLLSRQELKPLKRGDLIGCESTAAIVPHIREVTPEQPISYTGSDGTTYTLCNMRVGWDIIIPLDHARCKKCLAAMEERTKQ